MNYVFVVMNKQLKFLGEYDNCHIQRKWNASRRGWLAERYKYARFRTDCSIQT